MLLTSFRLLLCCILAAPAAMAASDTLPPLKARPASLCDASQDCQPNGHIRLLGVLNLPSLELGRLRFSQLSGLAWDEHDGILYTVSDKGALFGLLPVFRNDRLVDVSLVSAAALLDPKTGKPVKWRRSDSEGLEILNARRQHGPAELLVSFEGEPRLAIHRPDGSVVAEPPLGSPLNDLAQYRYNRMLEGVCVHPREGILTAPEEPMSIDYGTSRLYRQDGHSWQLPAARGGIVALECLPDGDILVLERDFSTLSLSTAITLWRIQLPPGTPPGQLLAGSVVAALNSSDGLKLDNFEGLARHRDNRYFMVSDDNDLFLQRTLLIYFELSP